MFLFGPPDLMEAKKDVKGLIKALGYGRDAAVRQGAAQALGEINDVRGVEPLIAALEYEDRGARCAVVKALGHISDARSLEPLIPALKDTSKEVRQAAAAALVSLYRSDRLDQQRQRLILAQRPTISRRHEDIPPPSSDCGSHADTGIGIDFPV
jgi:HEAT repeat protein